MKTGFRHPNEGLLTNLAVVALVVVAAVVFTYAVIFPLMDKLKGQWLDMGTEIRTALNISEGGRR